MKLSVLKISLLGSWLCCTLAQAQITNEIVQPPTLKPPGKGSVAGDIQANVVENSDLSQGGMAVPLTLQFPQERGKLLYSIQPTYRAASGLSEWGMGFHNRLMIQRWQEGRDINYETDGLLSPWGVLKLGTDGFWYPQGLGSRVRVSWSTPESIDAFLEDGTQLQFGRTALVRGPQGVFAWYLTEAISATGDRSQFEYSHELGSENYPLLKTVRYGGSTEFPHYQLSFEHESIPAPPFDYRSGRKLVLNQRVKNIAVTAKNRASGAFSELYHYSFNYVEDSKSSRFYLSMVQRTFSSGNTEPAQRFDYDLPPQSYQRLDWHLLPQYDRITRRFGPHFYTSNFSNPVDINQDGTLAFEENSQFQLIQPKSDQVEIEPLKTAPPQKYNLCRKPNAPGGPIPTPRNLVRFFSPTDPLQVFANFFSSDTHETHLLLCDREGQKISDARVPQDWTTGPLTRLVDLSHKGRPDLVRFFGFRYLQIAENISTPETGIQFKVHPPIELNDTGAMGNPLAIYVVDLNGDGIPDVVARYSGGLRVWYGLGNYQFSRQSEYLGLWNPAAKTEIPLNDQVNLTFADINQDGLPDLIVSNRFGAQFFLNQVGAKVPSQRLVKMVVHVPYSAAQSGTMPSLLDLSGSGNTQIVASVDGKIAAAELSTPGMGLMKKYSDGKGTSLSFNYTRMRAEPGIGSRAPILSQVTIQSSGVKPVTYDLSFSQAQMHPVTRSLLGFEEIQNRIQNALGQTIEQKSMRYSYPIDAPALLLSSTAQDTRNPSLEKVQKVEYQDRDFAGIKTYQKKTELAGFQSSTGTQAATVQSFDYDENLCPTQSTVTSVLGTLTLTKTRTDVKDLSNSLHCLPGSLHWTGRHGNRAFDFSQTLWISRNTIGLPTRFASGDSATRRLQELTYDPEFHIQSVSTPQNGTQVYHWEGGLLTSVTDASGKKVEVTSRNALRDQIEALSTDLGSGEVFTEFFRHDDWNRLTSRWNNIGKSSEANPLAQYFYQFAKENSVGKILVQNRVDSGVASTWKKQMEFFSATGETLGEALQVQPDHPQNWLVSQLTRIDPASGEKTLFQTKKRTLGQEALLIEAELQFDHLIQDAAVTGTKSQTRLGQALSEMSAIQTAVKNEVNFDTQVVDGKILQTRHENHETVRKITQTTDGKLLSWTNEANQTTQFAYDALGRLRAIELPGADARTQLISYDEHGAITRIARSEVGSVVYSHAFATGLLTKKEYLDRNGKKTREEEYAYDSMGRIVAKRQKAYHSKSADGAPELRAQSEFHYFYDGKLPEKRKIRGQLGRLTAVRGPGFTKRFKYRKDGQIQLSELEVMAGPRIVTYYSYRDDGVLKEKKIKTEGPSAPAQDLTFAFETDTLGRPTATFANGTRLLDVKYDDDSRPQSVALKSGTIAWTYDELTHRPRSFEQNLPTSKLKNEWDLNARGMIASESLQSNDRLKLNRNYLFSPEGRLIADSDESTERTYGYEPSGILTQMGEKDRAFSLTETQDQITVGKIPAPLQLYKKDSFGRIDSLPGDQELFYGPSGRVEAILNHKKDKTPTVTYLYDEEGIRLIKKRAGRVQEVYWDQSVLTQDALLQPLKVNGTVIGILKNSELIPTHTDFRGSVVKATSDHIDWISPYGVREGEHPEHAAALDYVSQGYDPDLRAFRMDHRDYDPQLKRFHTPDPLFLEQPDQCIESPEECNLYSYAKGNPVTFVDPSGLYVNSSGQELPGPAPTNMIESREYDTLSSFHAFDPNGRDAGGIQYDPIPEILVGGLSGLLKGICAGLVRTEATVAASEAGSAIQGLNLSKSLASQAQTGEPGVRIAGEGAKQIFRDAGAAAEKYGGKAADYVKMSSSSFIAKDGLQFSTHWIENVATGARHEMKTIINELINVIKH